ncbi:hypothetical protein ACU686_44450 [Yinghuangia aomiensis]
MTLQDNGIPPTPAECTRTAHPVPAVAAVDPRDPSSISLPEGAWVMESPTRWTTAGGWMIEAQNAEPGGRRAGWYLYGLPWPNGDYLGICGAMSAQARAEVEIALFTAKQRPRGPEAGRRHHGRAGRAHVRRLRDRAPAPGAPRHHAAAVRRRGWPATSCARPLGHSGDCSDNPAHVDPPHVCSRAARRRVHRPRHRGNPTYGLTKQRVFLTEQEAEDFARAWAEFDSPQRRNADGRLIIDDPSGATVLVVEMSVGEDVDPCRRHDQRRHRRGRGPVRRLLRRRRVTIPRRGDRAAARPRAAAPPTLT